MAAAEWDAAPPPPLPTAFLRTAAAAFIAHSTERETHMDEREFHATIAGVFAIAALMLLIVWCLA
jgi:hypothetical protein